MGTRQAGRLPKYVNVSFYGLALHVRNEVFVPQPASEELVSIACSAPINGRVVDVGTGSGALALAVARNEPRATVFGSDISRQAIRCAKLNAARLGLGHVRFARGSLLAAANRFGFADLDLVMANLPYLVPGSSPCLPGPVQTYVGTGEDGLGLARELAAGVMDVLRPDGLLLLQVDASQTEIIVPYLDLLGFGTIDSKKVIGSTAAVVSARGRRI